MTAVVEPKTGRLVAWRDRIPLRYEYTAGVAGEAFLRGLRGGRLLASKCLRCGEVRLPPRTYCLVCGGRTRVDVEISQLGTLLAVSEAHGSRAAFGYVTFAGTAGGVAQRILRTAGRLPKPGDPVRAVFVEVAKRTGSILDVEGFRTASGGARGTVKGVAGLSSHRINLEDQGGRGSRRLHRPRGRI